MAWEWLSLLVRVPCLHVIKSPDVLFGFRRTSLSEGEKKKSSQARNFKTLSFSEPMTETSSPNMFVDSLFPRL